MAFLGGIFGGNYSKEGPGVSKDEPQKAAFLRFFQLFFRKFSKLIQLNLLCLLPAAVVGAAMFFLYYMGTFSIPIQLGENLITIDIWRSYVFPLPLLLLTPLIPGVSFVTRNYVREEHAFVFSDFKDAIKGNWKFFFLNGLLCYAVYVLLSIAIRFYSNMLSNVIMYIPLGISLLFAVLFVFAQFYIPVMAITFDLKFKQIYKNAFIFAILGLWRNLLLVVILALLVFYGVYITPIMPLLQILLWLFIVLFGFSFLMYLINFMVYPLIEKYLLKPLFEKKTEEETKERPVLSEKNGDSPIGQMTEDVKKSQYVYVNGKLVRNDEMSEEEQVFSDRL